MQVVLCEPGSRPLKARIKTSLSARQKIVGGSLEYLGFEGRADRMLVCNSDGKLQNLPPNRFVSIYAPPKKPVMVVGTFFIAGYSRNDGARGNRLEGLSDHEAEEIILRIVQSPQQIADESEEHHPAGDMIAAWVRECYDVATRGGFENPVIAILDPANPLAQEMIRRNPFWEFFLQETKTTWDDKRNPKVMAWDPDQFLRMLRELGCPYVAKFEAIRTIPSGHYCWCVAVTPKGNFLMPLPNRTPSRVKKPFDGKCDSCDSAEPQT